MISDQFTEHAWDIARTVAEIDKQLLSSSAVAAFATLARSAYVLGQTEARTPDTARLDWLERGRWDLIFNPNVLGPQGIWAVGNRHNDDELADGKTAREALDKAMIAAPNPPKSSSLAPAPPRNRKRKNRD